MTFVVNASSTLSTVGQSAGTVLKHPWYSVCKKAMLNLRGKKTVHEKKRTMDDFISWTLPNL